MSSDLRLVWVYPDLLSTYGDRGNLLVLERRARLRGINVECVFVNSDQPVPRDGDIYLLGGGEDLPQVLAARRLRADGGLAEAAGRGAVVFAVCAGYQLLDHEFGRIMNANIAEYHVPVNADVHDIEVIFVDEPDAIINPLGIKGIGEIGIVGVAAAIANAIYHSTGKRVRDLPITLDKLLPR